MKKLLALVLLASTGAYGAYSSTTTPSVPTTINVPGQTGIVVKGAGGITALGTPQQERFSPNVYAGGIDFDFGDPTTPGFARNPANATSSYFAMVKDTTVGANQNKLVVCGFAPLGGPGGAKRWVVARYTSAGVLDTGFGNPSTPGYYQQDGTNGTTNFNDSEARGLAIDADGKIVVCGYSTQGGIVTWTVARYTAAGIPDTTFNTTGFIYETELGVGIAYSVSIGATGLLYVGGYTTPASVSVITTISYTALGARNAAYNP